MSLITNSPIPVFNTSEFPSYFTGEGEHIPLDDQGLMRALETILLPGMSFDLQKKSSDNIFEINTPNYSGKELYIDRRFSNETPSTEQPSNLPSVDKICETLRKLIGTPYLWGGNWPEGIPKMLELYPPAVDIHSLDPKIQNIWQLKGVDCSGLLYYATKGYTPRNTSDLVTYKKGLNIENLEKNKIALLLEPLDLIAWKGHVIIVIDKETCMESTIEKGVHLRNLSERIEEVLETRQTVNQNPSKDYFVIRRWYSDNLNSSKMRRSKQSCCIL